MPEDGFMRNAFKWVAACALAAIVCLALRRDGALKIPHQVLYSHYRIVAKVAGDGVNCGTGVAISKREILTASHVVEEGETFELDIFDADGQEIKTIPLRFKTADKSLDLALLESDEDLPIYNDLDPGEFEIGSHGYVVGCSHATVPFNVYVGVFASKHGPNRFCFMGQIAITSPPGVSGGGVYNDSHKLVGILLRSREGFSFFLKIKDVLGFLKTAR